MTVTEDLFVNFYYKQVLFQKITNWSSELASTEGLWDGANVIGAIILEQGATMLVSQKGSFLKYFFKR